MKSPQSASARASGAATAIVAVLAAAVPSAAHASFLPPELMDKAATYLAWFIIIAMPIAGVVLFWLVHILPEKIAHKRHHPQQEAIQVLCLLSLVFGGLLWPLAWLWAYSKPVLYKMAYGTDKAGDTDAAPAALTGADAGVLREDVARLRADLERLMAQGGAPRELSAIRDQLAALEPRLAARPEEAR